MGDESGSRKEYETRAYRPKSAPSTWLSIHSQRSKKQTASGKAGYRPTKVQNRYLRPRLLLASTSKLQTRNDSKIQSRVLEFQIQTERGARPSKPKSSEGAGLAMHRHLGMRTERRGKNDSQNRGKASQNSHFQLARRTGRPGLSRGNKSDLRQKKVGAALPVTPKLLRPLISKRKL